MRKYIPKNRLYRHLLFWLLVFLYFFTIETIAPNYGYAGMHESALFWLVNYSIIFLVGILYLYAILYWILPFLIKNRYTQAVLGYIFITFCMSILNKGLIGLKYAYLDPLIKNQAQKPFDFHIFDGFFLFNTYFFEYSMVVFTVSSYKLFDNWLQKTRESESLAREKIHKEIQLIKTQINPNFLFNSLDILHKLTSQKSPQSPKVVMCLSQLLSYLLYESQANEVPLKREIEMIQNYCFLEQTRLGKKMELSLNFTGDIEHKKIAPLLLLPCLENAFKDANDENIEQLWISIDLSVVKHLMKFKINSTLNTEWLEPNWTLDKLKRQVAYLYPNYQLKIIPDEGILFVGLQIELNQNENPLFIS